MKRILILALMLSALFVSSQNLQIDFHDQYDIDTWTVTKDTTWAYDISGEHIFEFSFIWTSLNQTDGSVKLQYSPYETGDYWFDFPSLDSVLMNSATGYGAIRSTTTTLIERRVRIALSYGTVSSGTFLWRGNLITVKRNL